MIISHKHKFIFVKCGKVAGTSIEIALRPYLGEEDTSTPVVDYDELYAKENGIPLPQNYKNSEHYNKRVREGSRGIYYEHAWAYEIKGLVGDEIWDNYYTFAIERDPRDKSLSTYFHHKYGIEFPLYRNLYNAIELYSPFTDKIKRPHPSIAKVCSLSRWLEEDAKYAFSENWCRYTANDKLIVDKVYSFNDISLLVSDLENMVSSKLNIPRLKSGFRKNKTLTLNETRLLNNLSNNEIYQKEFEMLGLQE